MKGRKSDTNESLYSALLHSLMLEESMHTTHKVCVHKIPQVLIPHHKVTKDQLHYTNPTENTYKYHGL